MNTPVFVRQASPESVEILPTEVVPCAETAPMPPAGKNTTCRIPGCLRTIQSGLFGSIANESGACVMKSNREALLAGTFVPAVLEI